MTNRILKTYHFKTMLGHTVIDTYSEVPKVVSAFIFGYLAINPHIRYYNSSSEKVSG